MKICMITAPTYPVPAVKGGAVEQLIEILARENEKYQEIELTVVSSYNEDVEKKSKEYSRTKFVYILYGSLQDKFQEKKLFIYINRMWMKLKGFPLISQRYVKKAVKAVSGDSYDAYIVEGGGDPYNYRYLVKSLPHVKLWVHDHSNFPGDKAYKRMFSRFICVSNSSARHLVANGLISGTDVKVLPNCVNIDMFREREGYKRSEIRDELGFNKDDFIFIYWGRLIPEKGVLELAEAFNKVHRNISNTKLLIIGTPQFGNNVTTEYTRKLEASLSDKNVNDSVKFTGFIPHDEIWKYIKAAEVAILPSVWDEPAPLVAYEAFASKIPLITTRNGGIPELANDSNALVLDWTIDFADTLAQAMVYTYGHLDDMKILAERAYLDVLKYSEDNYYKNYVRIIRRFIDEKTDIAAR